MADRPRNVRDEMRSSGIIVHDDGDGDVDSVALPPLPCLTILPHMYATPTSPDPPSSTPPLRLASQLTKPAAPVRSPLLIRPTAKTVTALFPRPRPPLASPRASQAAWRASPPWLLSGLPACGGVSVRVGGQKEDTARSESISQSFHCYFSLSSTAGSGSLSHPLPSQRSLRSRPLTQSVSSRGQNWSRTGATCFLYHSGSP